MIRYKNPSKRKKDKDQDTKNPKQTKTNKTNKKKTNFKESYYRKIILKTNIVRCGICFDKFNNILTLSNNFRSLFKDCVDIYDKIFMMNTIYEIKHFV